MERVTLLGPQPRQAGGCGGLHDGRAIRQNAIFCGNGAAQWVVRRDTDLLPACGGDERIDRPLAAVGNGDPDRLRIGKDLVDAALHSGDGFLRRTASFKGVSGNDNLHIALAPAKGRSPIF